MAYPTRAPTRRRIPAGRIVTATLTASVLAAGIAMASTSAAATSHASKGITVSTYRTAHDGTVLVSGNTLYTLKPSKVACTTSCTKVWPQVLLPVGVAKATAGAGVKAAKLGKLKLRDGRYQVTYSGKALYWFSGDRAKGQVNGNVTDTWGTWSDLGTVKPAANPGTGGIAF